MAHDFAKQRAARANRSAKPAQVPWLWLASGNLLVPIVAHGAYDFAALVYLLHVAGSADAGASLESAVEDDFGVV